MYDLYETGVTDNRSRGLSGGPNPKHGTKVQEIVAHPLANVPEGKLGKCSLHRVSPISYFSSINIESLNALQEQFKNDDRPHKADLMCGVYQTEEGNPYVLPSVKLVSRSSRACMSAI